MAHLWSDSKWLSVPVLGQFTDGCMHRQSSMYPFLYCIYILLKSNRFFKIHLWCVESVVKQVFDIIFIWCFAITVRNFIYLWLFGAFRLPSKISKVEKTSMLKRWQLGRRLAVISMYATHYYGNSNYFYFVAQKWCSWMISLYVWSGSLTQLTHLLQNIANQRFWNISTTVTVTCSPFYDPWDNTDIVISPFNN